MLLEFAARSFRQSRLETTQQTIKNSIWRLWSPQTEMCLCIHFLWTVITSRFSSATVADRLEASWVMLVSCACSSWMASVCRWSCGQQSWACSQWPGSTVTCPHGHSMSVLSVWHSKALSTAYTTQCSQNISVCQHFLTPCQVHLIIDTCAVLTGTVTVRRPQNTHTAPAQGWGTGQEPTAARNGSFPANSCCLQES